MCLFTYQEQPVIADRPIECVKIMRRYEKNGDLHNLYSFAYHTTYKLGVPTNMQICDEHDREYFEYPKSEIGYRGSIPGGNIYCGFEAAINIYCGFEAAIKKGARNGEDEIKAYGISADAYRYRILYRGICSFIDEEDAQKTFDWAVGTFDGRYEICLVKCEIPAGARYWKGVSNCTELECGYVSDRIIPLEILKVDQAGQQRRLAALRP